MNKGQGKIENDKSQNNTVSNRQIFYESLVSNEKQYLEKELRADITNRQASPTISGWMFFRWLLEQFETIRTSPPPSTLIYSLEFLLGKTTTNGLFKELGETGNREIYLKSILEDTGQDYKKNVDILALASACKIYIKNHINFFDPEIADKLNEAWANGTDPGLKTFIVKRLPFIMENRVVFKLIRELIYKLDANRDESHMDIGKSIKIWARLVIPDNISTNKCEEILRYLLKVDFDYVPLSFYK